MVVFRNSLPVQVPADYATLPSHVALQLALTTNSYADAVRVLETAPADHWLAADVHAGSDWSRRFLNSTALLWAKGERVLAARGTRALLAVLAGTRRRVGRQRKPPLSPEDLARAAAAVAAWRAIVDRTWSPDRSELALALTQAATGRFAWSAAHRRGLRALVARQRLRKTDVVQAMASWEVGFPLRHRAAHRVADLVYG